MLLTEDGRTGDQLPKHLSKLMLQHFSVWSQRFYEIKIFSSIRVQSTHNVIPIFQIKLEYDLILPASPIFIKREKIYKLFSFNFTLALQKLNLLLVICFDKRKATFELHSFMLPHVLFVLPFYIWIGSLLLITNVGQVKKGWKNRLSKNKNCILNF